MSGRSPATDERRRGRSGTWAAALGVVIALIGALVWIRSEPPATPSRASRAAAEAPPPPAPKVAAWRPGAPRGITIRRLRTSAAVQPIDVEGGTLVPPQDPARLGWWADGARPGDATGSVLLTGHTVHGGGGALDRLDELRRGDAISVRTRRHTIEYAVRRVAILDKGVVARRAGRLFSQEVPGRLVLVTCEGWDGAAYRSNVVVTAAPLSWRR